MTQQQPEDQKQEQPNEQQAMIDVSFKLPNNVHKAALGISLLLGYDGFEDYLYELIQDDLRVKLGEGGLSMIMDDKKYMKKIHGK